MMWRPKKAREQQEAAASSSARESSDAPAAAADAAAAADVAFDARQDDLEEESGSDGEEEQGDEDEDDFPPCIVCFEPLVFAAVPPCNHRMVESEHLIVTKTDKRYQDWGIFGTTATNGYLKWDPDTECFYDDVDHLHFLKGLSKKLCPICLADRRRRAGEGGSGGEARNDFGLKEFASIDDLKKHLRHAHDRYLCDICLAHRKVFLQQQQLFTQSGLHRHIRKGDGDSSFKGHPFCKWCRTNFYGDAELYGHLQQEHFTCQICRRDNNSPFRYSFFRQYDDLERHFRKEHYLCEHRECLEAKWVVFASPVDLKAHMIEVHGSTDRYLPVNFTIRRSDRAGEGVRDPDDSGTLTMGPVAQIRASDRPFNAPLSSGAFTSGGHDQSAAAANAPQGDFDMSGTDFPSLPADRGGPIGWPPSSRAGRGKAAPASRGGADFPSLGRPSAAKSSAPSGSSGKWGRPGARARGNASSSANGFPALPTPAWGGAGASSPSSAAVAGAAGGGGGGKGKKNKGKGKGGVDKALAKLAIRQG
ncbi:unnamed protein product [Vitrella brassicaformis CCMP3155]|uniref:C2H2-type domain-containing protein n=1 Tax=Vitrella brassicaformis (strain CCMP3155) TaxID=1169540 RepID=A0A0G4G733_VITBC|nr:unnamed protein product [Vitrella brassicaformis CCMP3155]|eukprot:CEM24430.1 unnamed protein product [Vitrella brassicaformis CCMP3155]